MQLDPSLSAVITGVVIPFVLPLIFNSKWSSKTKAIITFVFALAGGVINAIVTGTIADIPTVLSGVVIVYQMFNKTGVFDNIGNLTTKVESEGGM